jgi:hypothetical protein
MKTFLDSMVERLHADGGFSAYMLIGQFASKGYAVSCHKGLEQKTPAVDIRSTIAAYVVENFAILAQVDNVLGAWLDESNTLWLDISTVVESLDEALQIGRANNQVAIYDFQTKEVIPCN